MSRTNSRLFVSTAMAIVFSTFPVFAQDATTNQHDDEQMQKMHSAMQQSSGSATQPTQPGQGAFGAIAEIVDILSADPKTDWGKVNLGVLREHLVDMNRVTLEAEASETVIDGGLEIVVSGQGRTLKAIQSMVIAHARQLDLLDDWTAVAEKMPGGARLRVTSSDVAETARIRGLGFFGLMASGAHHQPHHIGMARGQMVHAQ